MTLSADLPLGAVFHDLSHYGAIAKLSSRGRCGGINAG